MNHKVLAKLPVPDSKCGDIRVHFENCDLYIDYEYRVDGIDWVGNIRFLTVVAFRFRDELRSLGFCPQSYDAIVQIEESDWMAELKCGSPPNKMFLDTGKHYAVFFSSNGYFEVIAEKFEIRPSRPGFLNTGT